MTREELLELRGQFELWRTHGEIIGADWEQKASIDVATFYELEDRLLDSIPGLLDEIERLMGGATCQEH
jgi:hypothetical protein